MRQWQPETIRKLTVRGWFPASVCGDGRTQFNFTYHENDIPGPKMPYGGSFGLSNWNMQYLFYEHLKYRNRWSRSNRDLDLVRYLGLTLRLYRMARKDYIFSYSRETPMTVDELSHMGQHPQIMLLQRKKVIVRSREWHPRGRPWVTVKIKPPRLMLNRWYFQRQLCKVNLVQMRVTTCELQYPWIRTGAESPAVGFYVLKNDAYTQLTVIATEAAKKDRITALTKMWQERFLSPTEAQRWLPESWDSSTSKFKKEYATRTHNLEKWYTENTNKLVQKAKDYGYPATEAEKIIGNDITLSHEVGMYSPLLLSDQKDNTLPSVFLTVRYNPLQDEGKGNAVWFEPLVQNNAKYDSTRDKCYFADMPLWLCLFGLMDWLKKLTGRDDALMDHRLCIKSPYTSPALVNKTDPTQGWVPYGYSFSRGMMPPGAGGFNPLPPLTWWNKWYLNCFHQLEVTENLVSCGPWVARDKQERNSQVTIGYKFKFLLGGVFPPGQGPTDPCTVPSHALPEPNIFADALQVSDPSRVGQTHPWDWRRGLLSGRRLKRMLEESEAETSSDDVTGPKIPRADPPREGEPRPGASLWFQEPSPSPSSLTHLSSSETEASEHQQQLRHRLLDELKRQQRQQRHLKKGIQEAFQALVLAQRGHYIDPQLL